MSGADSAISAAMAQIGTPYAWGAESAGKAFDCSGLIQYAFGAAGISLPRTSQQQQAATTRVTSPMPGDLVFYGSPAEHVGLYIGNGRMIDAADYGQPVQVRQVWGSPTYGRVAGAGTGLAPLVGAVTGAAGLAGDAVQTLTGKLINLTGIRKIVLEGLFVVGGVVLVGAGLGFSVWQRRKG